MEDSSWRSQWVEALQKLVQLPRVPILLMSGTVPVQFEHEIWEKLGLGSDTNHTLYTRVLRTSTQRHNLSYQLINLDLQAKQPGFDADEAQKTAWLEEWLERSYPIVQQAYSRLSAVQRGILFFVQKQFTTDFAKHLELPCVTGDTSQANRDSIWQRWRKGETKVVCTNKAGYYGIDYPYVAFTIHIDRPMSMLDFAQSSGRAGRSGSIALSLVLVPFKSRPSQRQQGMKETFAGGVAVTILYSLDSMLNPHRILNSWAHLDGTHIIGTRSMRAFEWW